MSLCRWVQCEIYPPHLAPTAGQVEPGTLGEMMSEAGWRSRRARGIKRQCSWCWQQSASGTWVLTARVRRHLSQEAAGHLLLLSITVLPEFLAAREHPMRKYNHTCLCSFLHTQKNILSRREVWLRTCDSYWKSKLNVSRLQRLLFPRQAQKKEWPLPSAVDSDILTCLIHHLFDNENSF